MIQLLISFLIVAFGQPIWSWWLGLAAALFGYALFFGALLKVERPMHRFWLGLAWATAVQMVQLSWLLAHPYWYIFLAHFGLSLMTGVQIGFLSLFITKENISKILPLFALAALWTLLEWSRLFILVGYSFNPAGLALSGSLYPLQIASLFGVYGMSFWVLLTNLVLLHLWVAGVNSSRLALMFTLVFFPYLFGFWQLNFRPVKEAEPLHVVLVQTAFPAEETLHFSLQDMIHYVLGEWKQIFANLRQHLDKTVDLIVLPEGVVPFGTYTYAYEYENVKSLFQELFGAEALKKLPAIASPFSFVHDSKVYVNNAFISQALANLFQSGVVIGLEDATIGEDQVRRFYSAAQYFQPDHPVQRYEKRVLVPLGEYIPLACLANLCRTYGVQGSFTPGAEAKVMERNGTRFGVTICYEETFGHMMRENRQKGAGLLVNVTSDVWYPNSTLPQVHFDHAKLRTVENGLPLARACNTGVTGVIDCFGRNISILGEGDKNQEWLSDALYVKVPMATYSTLYARSGDGLIVVFCLGCLLLFFLPRRE